MKHESTDPHVDENLRKVTPFKGPIAWFARNHVAANLLFLLLILIGGLSVLRTKLEVFPQIDPRIVTVSVPYPGANPEEVEQGVLLRLEEAVADVEGIKKLGAIAVENQGVLSIEATNSVDMEEFYEDVKAAVDRISTLPVDAEEPVVSERDDRFQVMTLALYGDVSRRTLKEAAEQLKDDLQQTGAVSQITIDGIPPYEISIEIDEPTLRQYGLTFNDVAEAIRDSSLDLPAGTIEGKTSQVLVRSTGQAYRGEDFENIVVRTADDGTSITVGDLAEVIDGFEDNDYFVEFDGQPAALLNVYRIGDEGALNVAATVQEYVAEAEQRLPAGISIATYNDSSDALKSRIELMLKNAGIGLALVVLLLGLFLDLRLAFWSAAGLVMSVVASFIVLPMLDVSINMMSLFAFILVLGILVDDAIVVGENIYAHRELGKSPAHAAVDGVREVALPVSMTIATTIVAFAPLLFAEGVIGQILAIIPIVVIAVLVLSLVEALFILPAHLSGPGGWEPRGYTWVRLTLARAMDAFVAGPYRWLLTLTTKFRYITLACGLVVLMLSVGSIRSGFLPWAFFPEVESDIITANLELPPGASPTQTEAAVRQIADAAEQLREEYAAESEPGESPLIRHIQLSVGGSPFGDIAGGPGAGPGIASRDARIGEVIVELQKGEERTVSATVIGDRWRELVGDIPGARSLEFRSDLLRAGDPVDVELRSRDPDALQAAADWLKEELAEIEGVREIQDDSQAGRPEVQITGLTPLGQALGLRPADIFRQVRGAFYGEEAQRVQRGRDEVRVLVRYPEERRRSLADVENLFVRLPDGTEAPLSQIANYEVGTGYGAITRTDRRRVLRVTADVDTAAVTSSDVNAILTEQILPQLEQRFPNVGWGMEGEQQEQAESMQSLALAMGVAMVGIYGMLAVMFRSYVQPVVVMSAIPFGFAGAVFGHILMDQFVRPTPLSFLSMFGVVALSGVVVNDSLILIDFMNRNRMADGDSDTFVEEGVIDAGMRRFRPIFLTTVTTFFGLVPMILETSLQAQFIIPMAVSLGFGVLFATTITLVLVPALYMIVEDLRRLLVPVLGEDVKYKGAAVDMAAAS